MADISITAANVAGGTDPVPVTTVGVAGETITAGMAVYQKAADGRYWKAQCDGTLAEAAAVGIARHASLAGQPLTIQTSGAITIGGTVAAGTNYMVSAAAGAIMPDADLASGNYATNLGYGVSTTSMAIAIKAMGVAKA